LVKHAEASSDRIVSKRCYLLKEISDWTRYLRQEEDGALMDEIREGK